MLCGVRVIGTKYDIMNRGWYSRMEERPHGRGLWKSLQRGKDKFQVCLIWKIGDGSIIGFWSVCWLEGGSLRTRFS